MLLRDQLKNDLLDAMKQKDQIKADTIRAVNTVILNKEHAGNDIKIDNEDIIQIIQKEVKLRTDSIDIFQKANRQDLINRAKSEINVLNKYLPDLLSEIDIKEIIKKIISKFKELTIKDFGTIMKLVMNEVKGKADGKLVNKLVTEVLKGKG